MYAHCLKHLHFSRPIYGVQFHPEKTSFEWGEKEKISAIPHWRDAVRAAQYLANFFVDEGGYYTLLLMISVDTGLHLLLEMSRRKWLIL